MNPIDDDQIIEDEESTELSYADIYDQLLVHGEMIVTISPEADQPLRKGLASVKSKHNQKLKDAGLPVDRQSLSFETVESKEHKGFIDMKILLAKKTSIRVLSMKLPDSSI